jgi:ribosomal protein L7Ae-like RNA K-turn-binding protein
MKIVSRASKVYQLLGLARRAGTVVHGTEAVREAIRCGDAELVVLASDASPTQLEKIRRTLGSRGVRQVSLGDRAALGAAVGVAAISAVAVTSASLADRVSAELGDGESASRAVEAVVAAAKG